MSLEFMDSFDHYATADILAKWDSLSNTPTVTAAAGRRGTAALVFNSASDEITKTLASKQTRGVGCAFKTSALPSSNVVFLRFMEGATVHVAVRLNTDGTLSVLRSSTVLATSSSALISANTFAHIEVKATIDNSAGAYEVRVNGSAIASLTASGVDTQNGGTAISNAIQLVGATSADFTFDDLFVWNADGSLNNTFIGDQRCSLRNPNGNGNSSQLDGSDGNSVDNYLLVDDSSPDADSTYVETSTATEKDTYAFENLAHTPSTIAGVQIVIMAKKDDAGARSIAAVTRSGGTDTDGATQALTTDYKMYREIRETDPNTSAAWTKTNLDAAEFGVKCAA